MEDQLKNQLKRFSGNLKFTVSKFSEVIKVIEQEKQSHNVSYSSTDLLNALTIFLHILKNVSRNIGRLNSENSERKAKLLIDFITKHFL